MTHMDWLSKNLIFDRKMEEIIFNKEDYVIGVKVNTFVEMFGEVIQRALDASIDVRDAIVESDPNNELGYNHLI